MYGLKREVMVPDPSRKISLLLLLLLCCRITLTTAMRVAVTGTTGRLGREAVQLLSSRGIPTNCVLRHTIDSTITPSIAKDASSAQVASYLSSLPGGEHDIFYCLHEHIHSLMPPSSVMETLLFQ